jgi:multidrug efflux pump subunit AcrB
VLSGSILMLLLTGTTFNLESFMGTIMAIGVAVPNAILLVSFAEQNRLNWPLHTKPLALLHHGRTAGTAHSI